MRFKLAVAAIAAIALGAGGVALASADSNGGGDDHEGKTIKFFALTVQTADIDLGDKGFSLGDQTVFSDDLYNKKGGTKLGVDGGVCTIVRITDAKTFSGTAQCVVTASLAGGQIATQGLVSFAGNQLPPPFDIAITGGTGAYKNASGQVTVQELSDTEANLTVQLSGESDDDD
jgi:hypothetical protein